MHASAAEIDERWSISDACDAHDFLDEIDESRNKEAAKRSQ
jgi:hypothetical protein